MMTPEEMAGRVIEEWGVDGDGIPLGLRSLIASAIRDAYERAAKTLDDEVVALSREADRIREIDHKHAGYCHALASRAAAYAAAIRALKEEG